MHMYEGRMGRVGGAQQGSVNNSSTSCDGSVNAIATANSTGRDLLTS